MNWYFTHHRAYEAHVLIVNEVGIGSTAAQFIESLGTASDVHLRIDSPGGESWVAIQAYEELKKRNTIATITGACGSSSLILTLAARHIVCQANSKILVHAPATFVYGDADELEFQSQNIRKLTEKWLCIICTRTKQPADTVRKWLSDDTWFTAQEALAVGLVDQIEPAPMAQPIESCSTPVGEPPAIMPASEQAFRYWLDGFPKIETCDRDALLKALNEFAMVKIIATSAPLAADKIEDFPTCPRRNSGLLAAMLSPVQAVPARASETPGGVAVPRSRAEFQPA